ncbi:hypothetical protein K505DRAFT_363086 [Melanomma pulvis-pyrius CBS 109.77]|uniref:C2H2-type domain-containing protein n=1 Tax=Melanomma pulvis-pyrius CBS 109.77 TaxID=1314802 RepID=A0A6A6X7H2_9PLEO|nr:hypothetical protein K505DRAFT_363086 [Melanomma pulvis-pyrius CBS 109.77]
MSTPQTHPRRRPLKVTTPQATSSSTHTMSLRKSGTFSSRTSISSDDYNLENIQYRNTRSLTGTEHGLAQLLDDPKIDKRARRLNISRPPDHIINFMDKFNQSFPKNASILHDREVLPLPTLFLDSMENTPMDIDSKLAAVQRSPHDHASDSGLGSSISGSKNGEARSQHSTVSTALSSSHGAITRSFSALGSTEEKHTLGEYACKQIHDTIIKPILAEESLKDFHPLINDVPRRIGEKNITNLRDLEKTLIFLAPVSGIRYLSERAKTYCILRGFKEFSATPKSYLEFCETSIRLLHATVDNLSEQDQRLPSDRPYTNNYFLDLIEQIRRYAAIMAATRQKEANGEDLDEMDYTPGEKVTLRGGLSHNGRPAELVREKNGKVIPLNKDSPYEDDYKGFSSSKRTLSDTEMDDDEVMRSMARRRKSDKPGDVLHVCRDCKKDFKRPCDLTKHEKTHSRPWKCTEEKCKYYDLGWPTEKERDRHVNDKHSAAPPQYKCLYPPCTYASKRESNCKQHMEKAHGWEYVRSKSNGRKKGPTSSGSEPSPLTPFIETPQSAALTTPITPFIPSPSIHQLDGFDFPYGFGTPALSVNGFQDDYRRDSVTTDGSILTYSSGHSPTEPTSFEDAVTPEDTTFNHNDILNCGNTLTTNFNTFQQHTPAMSTGYDFDNLNFNVNATSSNGFPHLSPGAQPDVTLFSPAMHIDEGYSDGMAAFDPPFDPPSGDFTLFETTQGGNMGLNPTDGFFPGLPEMNQMGGQFDQNLNIDLYADPSMSNFDDLTMFGNPQ